MKYTLKRVCMSVLMLAMLLPCMLVYTLAATCTVDDVQLIYSSGTSKEALASPGSTENGSATANWESAQKRFVLKATNSTYHYTDYWLYVDHRYVQNYSVTLTLTNDTTDAVKMQYTIADEVDGYAAGTYTTTLLPGGAIIFSLASKAQDATTQDAITHIGYVYIDSLTVLENVDVTFASSTRGGYTYQIAGGEEVDMAAGAEATATQSLTWGAEVTLTQGTPEDGYGFYGWMAGNTFLGTEDGTYAIQEDAVIYPVYLSTEEMAETEPFKVGDNLYRLWAPAFADAKNSGNTVVINRDYTLPTDLEDAGFCAAYKSSDYATYRGSGVDYKVPYGTTLLIPRDDSYTVDKTEPGTEGYNSYGDDPPAILAFRTLTMATGANITVNGAISVAGSQRAGGAYISTTGPLGFIQMNSESTITVNSGGFLYAWGYITGSGSVTAKSGATVYEQFQVGGWRGGDMTTTMINDDKGVFPMSQYYVQNIEVPLTLEAGATEHAFASTSITLIGIQAIPVAFVGDSTSMFNIANGYVVKDYIENQDRLEISVHGDVTLTPIEINMKLGILGSTSLKSKDFELPLNNNMTIHGKSGNLTIDQDVALLPGTQIIIDNGVTCTLGEGVSIYAYDADQWDGYCGASNKQFMAVFYAPGRTYSRTTADLVDASICVNGFVDASQGYLYTTNGGANVYSTGSGKITTQAGTQTVTYQVTQAGEPGDSTYPEIPITSAQLKNSDGTYVQSGTDTYTYINGNWRCGTHPSWETDEEHVCTCSVCGILAVAEVEGNKYTTLKAAVDASNNKCITMLANTNESDYTVDKAITLDLNKFNVTVAGTTATISGIDSGTNGYQCTDENLGSLNGVPADKIAPTATVNGKHYLAITDAANNKTTTFHRVAVSLTRYAVAKPNIIVEGIFRGTSEAYEELSDMGFVFTPEIQVGEEQKSVVWYGETPGTITDAELVEKYPTGVFTMIQYSYQGTDNTVTPMMKLITISGTTEELSGTSRNVKLDFQAVLDAQNKEAG